MNDPQTGRAEQDGRARGAEPIGDILARLAPRYTGRRRRKARNRVHEAWERAAGPELVEDARPGPLHKGVLTIEVRSAALLSELEGFRKQQLLSRLLEEDDSGRVTGLRFRIAVF